MANTPIHILHILETKQFAGTEAHVLTLMQGLKSDRACVSLLCRQNSPLHKKALDLDLNCITAATLLDFVHVIRSHQFSILHAHDGQAKIKAVLGMKLARSKGKLVVTQHFLAPAYTQRTGWKKRLSAIIHKLVNRQVAKTIAISQAVQVAAIARSEVLPSQIVVVPNGISVPTLPEEAANQAKLRLLNIPDTAPLVCTVARLSKEKGIEYLLDAATQVLEVVSDAHFLIIGEGMEYHALEAKSVSLGIDKSVTFAGFRTDVIDLVAGCNLFVLPSPAEPFGLAILEAMALSKPVVAARAGGPLEIVKDGETGLLASPADAESLADCILVALLDAPRAAKMGEAGNIRLHNYFTAATMVRSTEAIYVSVLQ